MLVEGSDNSGPSFLNAKGCSMKKIVVLSCICLLCVSCFAEKKECKAESVDSFVIPAATVKKGSSKTAIKEEIGQSMKDVLDQCVVLQKRMGEVHMKLAKMQSHLFAKVGELIDNSRPFKKANRNQLKQSLGVLQHAASQLNDQSKKLSMVQAQLSKDHCLKEA